MSHRPISPRRALALLGACLTIALVAGCGEATSKVSFKGEKLSVQRVISSFASDASTGDAKAICEKILSRELLARLAKGGGCKKAIEEQLRQVDNFSLELEAISLQGKRASAKVSSTISGKNTEGTLALIEEKGHWRISGE